MMNSSSKIKLSEEHSGFIFEKDPLKVIELIKKHSGGSGSIAFQNAIEKNLFSDLPFLQPGGRNNVRIIEITSLSLIMVIIFGLFGYKRYRQSRTTPQFQKLSDAIEMIEK